ncbi:peptidase S8 and S53 subtilisin kexin sedolisin [Thermus thermophilus]|nr:peptidase S8 and S53 subtilisin kexin sedolisin [Thermus thermophilus]BDB11839.1 hypothetical protein TthTMY_15780 [Thermus thermophilus]
MWKCWAIFGAVQPWAARRTILLRGQLDPKGGCHVEMIKDWHLAGPRAGGGGRGACRLPGLEPRPGQGLPPGAGAHGDGALDLGEPRGEAEARLPATGVGVLVR